MLSFPIPPFRRLHVRLSPLVIVLASSLLLGMLAGGCGSGTDEAVEAPPERGPVAFEPEAPKNLLMIVLDATAAGRWPIYGHDRETTPFVTRMAQDAVVFSRAYSQATSTVPSVWSYFMGRYIYHPEKTPGFVRIRKGVDKPLAMHFRNAGFSTGGFSDNHWIRGRLGFDKGFDTFENPATGKKKKAYNHSRDETASEKVLSSAKSFIRSAKDDKFFCYVHFLRPHNRYVSPEPYLSRFYEAEVPAESSLREVAQKKEIGLTFQYLSAEKLTSEQISELEDLYDGNVAYSDHLIEELFGVLEEEGLLDDTMVVVMSDHGEAFGEHGKLLHTSEPYEELIHVPLVIRAPERVGFVRGVVDTPVELIDLAPTFRDLFNLESDHPLDGKSLVPLLRASDPGPGTETSISENTKTFTVSVRHGALKLMVRVDERYEEIIGYELYNLEEDPGETKDLFRSTDDIEALVRIATDYLASRDTGEAFSIDELTEDEIEELKAMGYLQ